jgi:hypothetical protein
MKYYTYIFVIILFHSCGSSSENIETSSSDTSTLANEMISKRDIGYPNENVSPSAIKNLKSQLDKYENALFSGELEIAYSHIYISV